MAKETSRSSEQEAGEPITERAEGPPRTREGSPTETPSVSTEIPGGSAGREAKGARKEPEDEAPFPKSTRRKILAVGMQNRKGLSVKSIIHKV